VRRGAWHHPSHPGSRRGQFFFACPHPSWGRLATLWRQPTSPGIRSKQLPERAERVPRLRPPNLPRPEMARAFWRRTTAAGLTAARRGGVIAQSFGDERQVCGGRPGDQCTLSSLAHRPRGIGRLGRVLPSSSTRPKLAILPASRAEAQAEDSSTPIFGRLIVGGTKTR
jgi:hypothetical protein